MIIDQTHIYAYQNLAMIYQMEYVELRLFKHFKYSSTVKPLQHWKWAVGDLSWPENDLDLKRIQKYCFFGFD